MKKNIILQLIKRCTIILLSLLLLSVIQLIWWIITGFNAEIGRFWGFILLIFVTFLDSILLTGVYYISYFIFGNKGHATNYLIFWQSLFIAIICYFSTEIVQHFLFASHQIITETKTLEHPLVPYFPSIYTSSIGFIAFSFSFIVGTFIEKNKED